MTVSELIEELKNMPQDAQVFSAREGEYGLVSNVNTYYDVDGHIVEIFGF